MADSVSKSWFVVFNNPEQRGYSGEPHEICERLKNEWCVTETRSGAWAYCIKHYEGHYPVYSEDGEFLRYAHAETDEERKLIPPDLPHVHMVLEDIVSMRFSAIKKSYAIGMHFEGTKGNKKEASDYITKSGDYDEEPNRKAGLPWEEIIYSCQKGEIKGMQGNRSDLQNIAKMLKEGLSPKEILRQDISYRKHETIIRQAYFDMRDEQTPEVRDVTVIWHLGASGTGKSYSRMQLCADVGLKNVYYFSDYSGAGFDKYNGEPYLWIDDFKGEFKYGDFLRYLDVYKVDLHCRYSNKVSLWNEVHITSVYHPKAVYLKMVGYNDRISDSVDQLLRRIHVIRYHFKRNGDFEAMDFPVETTIEEMRLASLKYEHPEWKSLVDDSDLK